MSFGSFLFCRSDWHQEFFPQTLPRDGVVGLPGLLVVWVFASYVSTGEALHSSLVLSSTSHWRGRLFGENDSPRIWKAFPGGLWQELTEDALIRKGVPG